MESIIGKTIKSRYRVDALLGRGGMAEVYKVYDIQRGAPLAMKMLREDLAEDRVFLRRFEREAQNLAKMQHPNIVRFYGLEQDGFLAFILMDYIQGPTLRKIIFGAQGPLEDQKVLEIMQPVCSALHYAHQQGIVHCDLKSANVMLDKGGKVYLTDFGIARMMDMATSTMVGIGTPAYMAPELIKGLDPTPQSDIYSLGIMLFEILTGGERPFTGEHADTTGTTADKVRWEHLHRNPPTVSSLNSKAGTRIDEVVEKCLAKDPSQRFTNTLEVYEALLAILGEEEDQIAKLDQSSVSAKKDSRKKETDKKLDKINAVEEKEQESALIEKDQENLPSAKKESISSNKDLQKKRNRVALYILASELLLCVIFYIFISKL
jgi:serine/threonine-protein kinase